MPKIGSKTKPTVGPRRQAARDMIGRAEELQLLLEACSDAPGVAVVEGEAGVGKSRLLTELFEREELAAHHKLLGHCHPVLDPFPLGPVVEALRGLPRRLDKGFSPGVVAGALRRLIPELSEHLPPEPPPLGDHSAERHRLFRALVEVLDVLGPTVLTLEDMQWAETGTCEFLTFLGSNLPDALTVVLTHRREDLGRSQWSRHHPMDLPPGAKRLDCALECLDPPQVSALIGNILETRYVSDEFAAFMHEKTSGLPFAVEELLRLLLEREDLVHLNGLWARRRLDSIRVPPAIHGSILERADRLSGEARLILAAAACVGRGATDELLAHVADLNPESTGPSLIEALDSNLISERADGTYAFRHALAEKAIHDSLLAPQRKELHLRAARFLEELDDPALSGQIADHYFKVHAWDKWVEFAEVAADTAASIHEDVVAFSYLSRALKTDRLSVEQATRLMLKLGTSALHGRMHEEAIPMIEQFLSSTRPQKEVEGELTFILGTLLGQAGSVLGMRDQFLRVVELGVPGWQAARCMSILSIAAVPDGDFSSYLGWADKAAKAAKSVDDPVLSLIVAADRASLLVNAGLSEGFSLAEELCQAPETVSERQEWIRACLNLAQAFLWLGYFERASALVASGLDAGDDLGYFRWKGALQTTQLLIDWRAGRWTGLADRAKELRETNADVPHITVDADLVRGWLALARGDAGAAGSLAVSVLDHSSSTGSIAAGASAGAVLVLSELKRDRAGDAVGYGMRALDLVGEKGIWTLSADLIPALTGALIETGQSDEAESLVKRFGTALEGRCAPDPLASLSLSQGFLAQERRRLGVALGKFRAAASAWEEISRPAAAAWAHEKLGECYEDESRAVDALIRARSLYCQLDATAYVTRASHKLKTVGGRAWTGGRKGYGDALSPREQEVVRLVAAGKTDHEIAAELFISPWTVKQHVSRAKRKLRVDRRVELGAAAPQGTPAP